MMDQYLNRLIEFDFFAFGHLKGMIIQHENAYRLVPEGKYHEFKYKEGINDESRFNLSLEINTDKMSNVKLII